MFFESVWFLHKLVNGAFSNQPSVADSSHSAQVIQKTDCVPRVAHTGQRNREEGGAYDRITLYHCTIQSALTTSGSW